MTETSTESTTDPRAEAPSDGAGKHRGTAARHDGEAAPRGRHRKPSDTHEAEAA